MIDALAEKILRFTPLGQNSHTPSPNRGLFVYNPKAGSVHQIHRLDQLRGQIPQGWKILETPHPQDPGMAFDQSVLEYFQEPGYLVTLGGDGTVQRSLSPLVSGGVLSRVILLRVPLGTGNDSMDLDSLMGFLREPSPSIQLKHQSVIRLQQGNLEKYAFNIMSFGMDARVAAIANRIKGSLPRWGYDIAVDLAALISSILPGPREFSLKNANHHIQQAPLLGAFGVSGNRTYGRGKKVLPGKENLCLIDPMGLFKILRFKKQFYQGTHGELEEARFFLTGSFVLTFRGKLWFQADGETFQLLGEDGEIHMELIPDLLHYLSWKP